MIELAPQHKFGLSIASPVMPACGFFGYTPATYQPLIQPELLGALVTNPITLRPTRHFATPQAIEVTGGVILSAGPTNPGVKKVLRQYAPEWSRWPVPVIAHLPADDPADLARTAGALDGQKGLVGFELGLPPELSAVEVRECVEAVLRRSELPVLAKFFFPFAMRAIKTAIETGVSALVLCGTPIAEVITPAGVPVSGYYFGGGIVAHTVPRLVAVKEAFPDVPLIAAGGIHTLADVDHCLRAGAVAVQLDSVIFSNPAQAQQIMAHYQT